MINARKNRPLFFSKPKLVQNIGLCGNRRLPATQLRKPHDKANLKREESVCLLKVSQGGKKIKVWFCGVISRFRTTSLGASHELDFSPEKTWTASVSSLVSVVASLIISQTPPPYQWLLWTIRGRLSQSLKTTASQFLARELQQSSLPAEEHDSPQIQAWVFRYLFIIGCWWGIFSLSLFMI